MKLCAGAGKGADKKLSLPMIFHPSAYPFADYAAIRLAKPHHKAKRASLVADLEAAGLDLVHAAESDECALLFFGTAPGRHLGAGRSLYSEGYFFAGGILLPEDAALAEVAGRTTGMGGNGTTVRLEDAALTFAADRLGLSQIYVRQDDPQIVSNRIELAVRVLESLGSVARLDAAGAARMLLYATPFDDATPVAGLSLVPVGATATLDRHGIRTAPASRFSAPAEGYRVLLARAADEIVSNVTAVARRYAGANQVVSLSGGIDSRILLAAIIAAGLEKHFTFYTYGTRDSPDRSIARGLRALFNLREAMRPPAEYREPDAAFDRGFQLIWAMRKLDANEGFVEATPREEVILDGGCGENLRGFFSKLLRNRYGEDTLFRMGDTEILDKFVRERLFSTDISPGLRKTIEHRVRKEICTVGSGCALTDIDMLYPHFRNRFHFGLGARVRTTNALTISPLGTAAGISASLSVSPQERATGRVPYDLICSLCPQLAAVPTTSGRWPELFARHQTYIDLPRGEDAPRAARPPKPNLAGAAISAAASGFASLPPEKRRTLKRLTALKDVAPESMRGIRPSRAMAIAQFVKAVERLGAPEANADAGYPLLSPILRLGGFLKHRLRTQ